MILLDQGKRQIDAGSDTCSRPYLSCLYEEWLRIDANFRELLGQLRARAPMGDSAALVKQTNLRQCEGAGADRADTPPARAETVQPAQSSPVFPKQRNTGTATHYTA